MGSYFISKKIEDQQIDDQRIHQISKNINIDINK